MKMAATSAYTRAARSSSSTRTFRLSTKETETIGLLSGRQRDPLCHRQLGLVIDWSKDMQTNNISRLALAMRSEKGERRKERRKNICRRAAQLAGLALGLRLATLDKKHGDNRHDSRFTNWGRSKFPIPSSSN